MTNPERVSLPWFLLLFEETLRLFTASYPTWTGIGIVLSLLILFLLPFIDKGPQRRLLLRPVILGMASAFLTLSIYFSLVGTANARYGERVILPRISLTSSEILGAQVFARKNCAYCHQVFGREGRREGPDMTVVKQRRRSPDWIRRYILNARLYQPGTTMPRYEIPLEDLEALSGYLLSLDPKRGFRTADRKDLLSYGPYLFGEGE
jgi:mono/diheme cytochrome c family protein